MKTDFILQNKYFNSLLCELRVLEQNRIYCKHDISHLVEVARIMLQINNNKGLGIPHDILVATALLHDLGRVNEYKFGIDHRIAGIKDITIILSDCGYTSKEIDIIIDAIKKHKDNSTDTLNSLLYNADKLSRPCYTCKAINTCKWDKNLQNKRYYNENR